MRALWRDQDGAWRTTLRGRQVLADPRINKGTAFGDSERRHLGLTGLIPAAHFTLDDQVTRVYAQYRCQPDDLARNITLNALHDRNEVLFYRLLTGHLNEMLPIVYTPTVGQAIEHYSREYRRPRGIYLSVDHPELIEASLLGSDLGPDDVDLIVATDAGAILGIGDWGSAASTSRWGSSPSTPRRAGSILPALSRSCWTWGPTGRACSTTRSISVTVTPGCPRLSTTPSSTSSSVRSASCSRWHCCTGRISGLRMPGVCWSGTGMSG